MGYVLLGEGFSADGKFVLAGGTDGSVRLWDVETGQQRSAYDWKVGKIRAVAFAPDGMRAAAAGDKDIVVWDVDA